MRAPLGLKRTISTWLGVGRYNKDARLRTCGTATLIWKGFALQKLTRFINNSWQLAFITQHQLCLIFLIKLLICATQCYIKHKLSEPYIGLITNSSRIKGQVPPPLSPSLSLLLSTTLHPPLFNCFLFCRWIPSRSSAYIKHIPHFFTTLDALEMNLWAASKEISMRFQSLGSLNWNNLNWEHGW